METIYELAAETARKVRAALKAAFPGVKFSVRADVYAGGSAVRVNWTDGPAVADVRAVTGQFESAAFDPTDGLTRYPGYEWNGRRYWGADWVRTSRHLSPDYEARVNAMAFQMFGPHDPSRLGYVQYQFEDAEMALRAQLAAS